jgi:uncharacterized lipoprotein YmbA
MRAAIRCALAACVLATVVSCGAPPLTLYTLGGPTTASDPPPPRPPLGRKPTVIEIVRVTIPDEIDTEDILVRSGSTLRRSERGRWASRLSLGITDRLTGRLAASRPDALVTDRLQGEVPTYRVLINISRLDVITGGVATLEADWLIAPHDPATPTRRNRARFTVTGPVATDQQVVTLEEKLLDQLAGAIDISALR